MILKRLIMINSLLGVYLTNGGYRGQTPPAMPEANWTGSDIVIAIIIILIILSPIIRIVYRILFK